MDLDKLQQEVGEWAEANFGARRNVDGRLHGMSEELGEMVSEQLEMLIPVMHMVRQLGKINHHHIKQEAGIRGTPEFHEEKIKDAVGDIFIFMLDYCTLRGWSFEEIVQTVWGEVQQRDWIEDPLLGLKRYKGQE